ncbi:MAG: hypothetical protein ACK559_28910, partial [bacterium]
ARRGPSFPRLADEDFREVTSTRDLKTKTACILEKIFKLRLIATDRHGSNRILLNSDVHSKSIKERCNFE